MIEDAGFGWTLGTSHTDDADGIVMHHRQHGFTAGVLRIFWSNRGDPSEIAARLRDLATALEAIGRGAI